MKNNMIEEKMEALKTADEYIDKLRNGINELVHFISEGKEEKAMEYIPLLSDGMLWVLQVLELTEDVHEKNIDINHINEKLNEVVEAVENEDYILIGDLFKYEILSILDEIQDGMRLAIVN